MCVNAVATSAIAGSQLYGPRALGLGESKQSNIPAYAFRAGFVASVPLRHHPLPEEYGFYALLSSRHNRVMTGQTVIAVLERSTMP